ncbi:hypothetical protein JRQ81_003362 [Phrynocephalus forsythii]|uniref:Uncharacterized protein n=1 Tax=Phrynocephalus forsythii TaxID=171643 RepID=A0A9Q0XLK3_9SAUR|nr:hypothetical protein JRQ81_003362 [Phrynocephalus forsythii]
MATASYRTRGRTKLPRRKKQKSRKKARHRKLLPKRRKQPFKQGRQGSKAARKQAVSPKKALRHPCDEFVSKVLRRLHKDRVRISTKAKGKMISFIRRFYNSMSDKAKCSKRAQRTSTIGSKELQKALKRVMRKDQATELLTTIQKVSRRH